MKHRPLLTSTSSAKALRRQAIKVSGAPKSVAKILDNGFLGRRKNEVAVVIREVGCTRRVFLLKPFLSSDELEGLAYRIRALTKNDSLNSVLIATDDRDDAENDALPSTLIDREYPYMRDEKVDEGFPPKPGQNWHVAGGYDPLALYKSGRHRNPEAVRSLLDNLTDLALAVRGDPRITKIPTICIPHGHVHDGGFAWCGMSSYVLATRATTFSIRHPSKGLALDPIGLSYILPRLGREFVQPAASYVGCGLILGLMGYEADAGDLMETGLATNYMESPAALGLLEHTLSELPPWNQQALLKDPVRYLADQKPSTDHNKDFRNFAVADTVHCFSSYRADGAEMWVNNNVDAYIGEDPSLEMGTLPWHEDRTSDLVNYAATFDDIFTTEKSLVGIYERFREVASRQTNDPEEQEGIDVAKDFCRRLERQSPLAVSAVYLLLREGAKGDQSRRSCMTRERIVQSKLLGMDDFENWAKFASSVHAKNAVFCGWKHKSLADVSNDEVLALLEDQ
jgi:enoyl-CoA hydratase/carnithine racemase